MKSEIQVANSGSINLVPGSGYCDRFIDETSQAKINIWLAPRLVKIQDGGTKIYWICNLSDICVSDCVFGMDVQQIA